MNPPKSPSPEGMLTLFYKKFWNTIKNDFIASVRSFFRTGYLLKQWNTTFITLIPKKENATQFGDFCPINLSDTCYKVISKILAERLKPLLGKIISPNQITCMKGKWINEHIILAQERIHIMNKSM